MYFIIIIIIIIIIIRTIRIIKLLEFSEQFFPKLGQDFTLPRGPLYPDMGQVHPSGAGGGGRA